ncbi:MAG: S8 family serine peptidase [Verrucomicrobiales bacterium]|nr:S8 family serine peptidase [Verrucomicrobiales bacterium]
MATVPSFTPATARDIRHRQCVATALGLAASLLCSMLVEGQDPPARPPRFRSNGLILVPKEGVDDAALDQWTRSANLETTQRHDWLGGLRVVTIGDGRSVDDALARAQASGLVDWVEPDYILTAFRQPNDPEFVSGAQWSLQNSGASSGTPDADIDATEAWDRVTDASSIIVAIIDSGLLLNHEDLAANLWSNPTEIAGNGIDDDNNGIVDDVHGLNAITGTGDPTDDVGHGTHVAGIIGAVGNNGRGTTGVAWKVQLMALKFLGPDGDGSTSAAIQCIDYARTHGARVINASWGGGGRSRSLELAIQRARSAGIVFVVAAGNDGSNNDSTPTYPASYTTDNLVVVAATTRSDTLASYSNFGASSVDLAAPGSEIRSTWFSSTQAYADASGTSMAAPQVTGALALLSARYPQATYLQLISAIKSSVEPLPSLAGKVATGGRLNIARALSTLASDFSSPATLSLQRAPPGTALILGLTGDPNSAYTLESTVDLLNWEASDTLTTDTAGAASISLTPESSGTRIFRVQQ